MSQHLLARVMMRSARARAGLRKMSYMDGPGGRWEQNTRMQGMTIESPKRHYSLLPLFGALSFAVVVPILYCYRLATKSVEVNWSKRKEIWNDYRDGREYKIVNLTPSKPCVAPIYDD